MTASKVLPSRVPSAFSCVKATAVRPKMGEGGLHSAGCVTPARRKGETPRPGRSEKFLGKSRREARDKTSSAMRGTGRLRRRKRTSDQTQVDR